MYPWKQLQDPVRRANKAFQYIKGHEAEASFADVKEDMNFRRYLYRGKKNVLAQSILLAIGRNFNKLHHKIQSGRTRTHLFEMKSRHKFKGIKIDQAYSPGIKQMLRKVRQFLVASH